MSPVCIAVLFLHVLLLAMILVWVGTSGIQKGGRAPAGSTAEVTRAPVDESCSCSCSPRLRTHKYTRYRLSGTRDAGKGLTPMAHANLIYDELRKSRIQNSTASNLVSCPIPVTRVEASMYERGNPP